MTNDNQQTPQNQSSAPLNEELNDQELDKTAAGVWTLDDCYHAASAAMGNTGSVCTGTDECMKTCTS